MTRTTLALTLVAAAALAGCNRSNQNTAPNTADDSGNKVANAHVELPPTIAASKIYRCKDNSVVYIDWLSDNKSANVRTDKSGTPTQLKAPEEGKPMVAEGGYSLTGTAKATSVTLALPSKGSQSCGA